MIIRVPSNEFTNRTTSNRNNPNNVTRKSYCDHVCEAIPLVCKNFGQKEL